jgi:subtilisin family serine protease
MRRPARLLLESLESRVMCSAAPAQPLLYPLAALPNESGLSNPSFSQLWHINNTGQSGGVSGADIHVKNVWDYTTGSKNVVVAVLDTGIDLDNADLEDNIWTNSGEIAGDGIDNDNNGFIDDVHGWNFVDGTNDVNDYSLTGHGTLVAGVLGAVGNNGIGITGVAQNITILPVKIGTDQGVSSDAVAAGINYVIKLKKMGLNVVAINASYLGVSGFGSAELNAISNAGTNGILYVSAAGNNAMNLDNLFYSFIKKPNQIVVAATDRDDNLWGDSNYGKNSVEIAAPGAEITSTWNKLGLYITSSGTSFAGPMVSGAIALLKSLVPNATMAQVKNAIMSGADVLPGLQGKVISNGRLNIESAMEILLAQTRFSGAVESATLTTITGWAYDAMAGEDPATVKLMIDGVAYATVDADAERPDLSAKLPSTAHGFSIALPGLSPGSHLLQVYAVGSGGTLKLLGAKTVVAKAPIGKLELLNAGLVKGYAYDPDDKSASIDVRIDIDGVTHATTAADASRPELLAATGSANHGFAMPLSNLALGFHRVEVFMLDGQSGDAKLLGTKTIFVNAAAQAVIENFTAAGISGYAWDPDSGSGATMVRIDIDALPPIFLTADENRPDIVGTVGSAGHGFSYALPQLMPGNHTIKVSVLDAQTGVATLVQKKTLAILNLPGKTPTARIESLTASMLKGNTFDRDDVTASLNVRIDIDGVEGTPFAASVYRPALKAQGGGLHGFEYDLTGLSAGAHRIDVYTFDNETDTPVLFYSKILAIGGSALPRGQVTALTTSTIAGWAFSPALGAAPANIRIDVDGVAGLITPADVTIAELLVTLGSTDHGFSVTPPKVSAGTHKISIYVIDPLTMGVTLLASKSLAFS